MPAIAAAAAAQAAPDAPQRVAAAADGLDPNPHVMAESGPELADGVGDDGAAGGRHMAPDRLALRLEAEP